MNKKLIALTCALVMGMSSVSSVSANEINMQNYDTFGISENIILTRAITATHTGERERNASQHHRVVGSTQAFNNGTRIQSYTTAMFRNIFGLSTASTGRQWGSGTGLSTAQTRWIDNWDGQTHSAHTYWGTN